MFDFFRKRTTKDYTAAASDIYGLPKPKNIPAMPASKSTDEYFRVGITGEGKTTLTVIGDTANITLTMNRYSCEHLIKMLQSTFTD